MVKYLFYSLLFFSSCDSSPLKEDNHVKMYNDSLSSTQSNITSYSTQFFLIDSINPKRGFGYNILVDGTIFIHQASIPAIPGNNTFSSKEEAEKVANLMIHKLRNNIMPPSISKHELDSLNILTPLVK